MSQKALGLFVAMTIVALMLVSALKPGVVGYYALPTGGASWETILIGGDFAVIQTLDLPPGNYIADATPVISVGGPTDPFLVDCMFTLDGTRVGELSRGMIGGSNNNFLTMPITAGFSVRGQQTLAVACRADPPGVYSQPTSISAIRVDNLVIQGGFVP